MKYADTTNIAKDAAISRMDKFTMPALMNITNGDVNGKYDKNLTKPESAPTFKANIAPKYANTIKNIADEID